jgi:hypothetical protein
MKTNLFFIVCSISVFFASSCMEQENKKLKQEETHDTKKVYTIPPLTEIVGKVIAHQLLREKQALPEELKISLQKWFDILPDYIMRPLTTNLLEYNRIHNTYSESDLALTLAEYIMDRSVKGTSHEDLKQKSHNEIFGFIFQQAKQGYDLEQLVLVLLNHAVVQFKAGKEINIQGPASTLKELLSLIERAKKESLLKHLVS